MSDIPRVKSVQSQASKQRGYRAESDKRAMARWLSAGLVILALFQLVPVFRQSSFVNAPEWTRIVVFICAAELAYAIWVAFLPDWSTVRVLMLVTASAAALYALAFALVMFSPRTAPIMLGLGDIRNEARLWCGAVLALTCLLSYICGHASFTWRSKYRKRHAPLRSGGHHDSR